MSTGVMFYVENECVEALEWLDERAIEHWEGLTSYYHGGRTNAYRVTTIADEIIAMTFRLTFPTEAELVG